MSISRRDFVEQSLFAAAAALATGTGFQKLSAAEINTLARWSKRAPNGPR